MNNVKTLKLDLDYKRRSVATRKAEDRAAGFAFWAMVAAITIWVTACSAPPRLRRYERPEVDFNLREGVRAEIDMSPPPMTVPCTPSH